MLQLPTVRIILNTIYKYLGMINKQHLENVTVKALYNTYLLYCMALIKNNIIYLQ